MPHGLAVSLSSPPITGLAKKSSEPRVWILNTSLTNFYRQVQGVLLWDTRNSKPQIGEMWPYNPETRAKFATMKNMKKEGYREGLLEIEEKHQNAAVEAMEEVNNVAPLGRIEEVINDEGAL